MLFHEQDHAANDPTTWVVSKVDGYRLWHLTTKDGTNPLQSFKTKREAEEARVSGHLVNLYRQEGRWFAGEKIAGWKDYSVVVAEQAARELRRPTKTLSEAERLWTAYGAAEREMDAHRSDRTDAGEAAFDAARDESFAVRAELESIGAWK